MTDLDRLVATVLASAKQRTIAPALVRWIGAQELAKGRSPKEAVKATKNKLHQLTGAYQVGRPDYGAWLAQLSQATADDQRTVCAALMAQHASTSERLAILDRFYTTLFAGLPPITSVLDLACGLNPLAAPWMALAPGATYTACDIDTEQIGFLNAALACLGVSGQATVCNLLEGAPSVNADVALLLKTIPCLEQVDKSIGMRLLEIVNAPVLIVSFPAYSLSGRSKGMVQHYAAHLADLVAGKPWRVEQFSFATELVFRITRQV
jgi:16S rRNA (guanine(1405)-N(7))-methyltransferase